MMMGKIIMGIIVLLFILIVALFIIRLIRINDIKQKIKITTLKGIEEETVIDMNGIKLYLNIRGEDIENPIIVMVHGGVPMTPIIHTYQPLWEKDYTVVNFDRRGAGESYFLNKNQYNTMVESMTPEQYIEDIKAVVEYVTQRFHKEKVIIMAHSFGTTLGSRFALKYPEMVEAYIGAAQIIDMKRDYDLCRNDMLERAKVAHDNEAVEALESININYSNGKEAMEISKILEKYIGKYISKEAVDDVKQMFIVGMQSPYFPISHLEYYMKIQELQSRNTDYLTQFNMYDYGNEFEMPAIFIGGSEDWLTRYTIEDYYDSVKAPYKKLIYIHDIGHFTIQVSPEEFYAAFNKAIKEVSVKE